MEEWYAPTELQHLIVNLLLHMGAPDGGQVPGSSDVAGRCRVLLLDICPWIGMIPRLDDIFVEFDVED
jgi:hypothetical protein